MTERVPAEPGSREPSPAVSALAGFDPSRIEAAIALAVTAHAGQVDKAGKPYILHPLRVMMLLDEPRRQVAAILHDVVEDSDIPLWRIEAEFGPEIADAVDALTRRPSESYSDFIERCGANEIARGVKWADLRDNMDMSRLPVVKAEESRYAKYAAARDRLTAIAIEAQRAATGTGAVHESAAIAQKQ